MIYPIVKENIKFLATVRCGTCKRIFNVDFIEHKLQEKENWYATMSGAVFCGECSKELNLGLIHKAQDESKD